MTKDIISYQNDLLRHTFAYGQVVVTRGIQALPIYRQRQIFQMVQSFENFTEGNDPYGEHDFGVIKISEDENELTIFWKIDCYDLNLEYRSPDPADPAVTKRVLTICLAEEY